MVDRKQPHTSLRPTRALKPRTQLYPAVSAVSRNGAAAHATSSSWCGVMRGRSTERRRERGGERERRPRATTRF